MKYLLQHNQNDSSYRSFQLSLQYLMDSVIRNLPASLSGNNVILINRVHAAFVIDADAAILAPVVTDLIHTVAMNARNTVITVSAEKYGDTVMLVLEDPNNYNGYALSFSLMAVEERARFIGGDLSITGARQRVATVSLSFPGIFSMPVTAES